MERSEQNADILYEDLKKNIMDVIKESQIKLGFEKNPVTIYYPIEALNHLLVPGIRVCMAPSGSRWMNLMHLESHMRAVRG